MAKEYIEREALTMLAYKSGDYGHPAVVDLEDIADIPTADVVEVVRCKDCVYRHLTGKAPFMFYICTSAEGLNDCKENAFCSYGERRTDE